MFPIRAGLNNFLTPDPDQVYYQSIAASAMHEIGNRAIQDVSLLMFHQMAAEIYHRQQGLEIEIETDENDQYIVYTPEQELELRKQLINVVMKYHIIDENGLGNRLTPLIESLERRTPIPEHVLADPFVGAVLNGYQKYSQALFDMDQGQVLAQILNFDTQSVDDRAVLNSYTEASNEVDVAIYEDDTVQCACNFCEKYFQIVDKSPDPNRLNFLQRIMAEKYNLI